MAFRCPHCKALVSEDAETCPSCERSLAGHLIEPATTLAEGVGRVVRRVSGENKKVNVGVRRLSLVLGLLVSGPWGLTTGTAFVSTTWSAKRSWDHAMSNWQAEQEKPVANVDSLRRVIEREKARENSSRESSGLLSVRRLAQVQLYRAEETITRQVRPRDWKVDWYWCWLFLASPIVFLVPWGTVRTIAWIIAGFRQETNPTSGVGDEDS